MISSADSIADLFTQRVRRSESAVAIWHKQEGSWQSVTWGELQQATLHLAEQLSASGLKPGTVVAHHSENRLAWLVLDLALHQLQAIHLPLHASFTPAQTLPLIAQGTAEVVIVSETLADGWKAIACSDNFSEKLSHVKKVAALASSAKELHSLFAPTSAKPVDDQQKPLAGTSLLLFTSGTAGLPHGVCLSSQALAANAIATQQAFATNLDYDASQRRRLTILPLSHVYALVCDFYGTIVDGAQLALASSRQTWLTEAAEIQPTFLNAVPFFYQRLQESILQASSEATPASYQQALQTLTGGKLIHCCIGGAAASPALLTFFEGCKLPLLAGYGLTENGPCVSVSGPHVYKAGGVGKWLPGLEAMISAEGEVLVRGPSVMLGYHQAPEATQKALKDGWLHTGDLGHLDADGYLHLVGRRTEMIVTSLGKNIWPTALEHKILQDPSIQQLIIVGDARPYLVALVLPSPTFQPTTHNPEAELLTKIGLQLANYPSHEQVRKVAILPAPFQWEKGELSGKNELCRSVIEKNYATLISDLYGS